MRYNIPVKLLFFTIYNFISCIGLVAFNIGQDLNLIISFVVIIQCILGVYVLKSFYPVFSLAPLFLIFSTIFHFGEAFLLGINRYDLFYYTNIDLAGDMYTYNLANIYAIAVQAAVVVGACLSSRNVKHKSIMIYRTSVGKTIYSILTNNRKLTYKAGLISALIGATPTVLYNYLMIKQTMAGGVYAGIRESVDFGPLMLLTIFFKVGVIAMILGSIEENKPRKAKMILVCAVIFELLCMLSGNRGKQLCIILTYIYIYYRYIGKFNWKKIIPWVAVGYVGISFLYFISSHRAYGIGTSLSELSQMFNGEPVFRLLAEQGSTLNMVALTLRDVPQYTSVKFGTEYLASLLSVFPNTGGWMGNLVNLVGTLKYLNTTLTLGDSYIAELFLNFWWFGILLAPFIGGFIGAVSTKIEYLIKEKNYLMLSCYMILFYKLLWMVRCNFFNFLYDFVWSTMCMILIILVMRCFPKNKRRIWIYGK